VEWKLHRRITASQRGRHLQIPINRMLLARADVDAVRVEERGQFAPVRESDSNRRAGLPRHPAAAEEPLQVDDEIKLPAAQVLHERDQTLCRRRLAPPTAEVAALEQDYLVQQRVVLQQVRARRREQPRDVRLRPAAAQQVEHRQRVHDVADRARLDQQDAAGR
jgi:hypothetical protein